MERTLATPRLSLRPWSVADGPAFHPIWGDPEVIFWATRWDRAETDAVLTRLIARCAGHPWPIAWHAASLRTTDEVIGSVCLQPAPWDAHEVEVGWHFRRDAWGHGYATEGAAALLVEAFRVLAPTRIVCSILPGNERSQRVAARLGFTRYAKDFLRGDLPHDLLELRSAPTRTEPSGRPGDWSP